MSEAPAPLIVSALFGDADFAMLDALRRRHFPPERNQVPAHLTLFHHLPPSIEAELKTRLAAETRDVAPPSARLMPPVKLGRGVAYRIDSPDLAGVRDRLADAFTGLLTPQDASPWRAHVTIQNKVEPAVAEALHAELTMAHIVRPLGIAGLAIWRYRGGPWEPAARFAFSRSARSRRN